MEKDIIKWIIGLRIDHGKWVETKEEATDREMFEILRNMKQNGCKIVKTWGENKFQLVSDRGALFLEISKTDMDYLDLYLIKCGTNEYRVRDMVYLNKVWI